MKDKKQRLPLLYIIVLIPFLALLLFPLPKVSFSAECPQARKTKQAPEEFLAMTSPLAMSKEIIEEGKNLYFKDAKPAPCFRCHGENGDGEGRLGKLIKPKPRNFLCKEIMDQVSVGQMFYIIRNGSPGSGMSGYPEGLLSNEDIWKIIVFEKSLSQ